MEPTKWTRQEDGDYVNELGYKLRHKKAKGGPIGTQTRAHRRPAHWIIIRPNGTVMATRTRKLEDAKVTADRRHALDVLGYTLNDGELVPPSKEN